MAIYNKAVDAYIAKSADFAKPILNHLRDLIHQTCPDVEEKMKWSMPFFDYMGEMMCHFAAFKEHCVLGFWKASLMKDKSLIAAAESESAMGHAGRITSLKTLPSDKKIIGWLKDAMALNENGIKLPPKAKPADVKDLAVPDYLAKALSKNKKAKAAFDKFPPGKRKEYIQWLTEAKTVDTRSRRMETAIEWIAEGKSRNWKYEKK